MFGACTEHQDGEDTSEHGPHINQVQASTGEEEALANRMNILAISDFDPASDEENQD